MQEGKERGREGKGCIKKESEMGRRKGERQSEKWEKEG